MLQLKEIKKNYVTASETVEALKGVSLSFRRKEFVSILGPSGCGKTTLLNIIGGLSLDEPAADLAATLALASSYLDRPIPGDLVAIGEVGLTGELRAVNQLAQRISEVQRLGFKKCVIPERSRVDAKQYPGLQLIEARNIGEAIRAALRPET